MAKRKKRSPFVKGVKSKSPSGSISKALAKKLGAKSSGSKSALASGISGGSLSGALAESFGDRALGYDGGFMRGVKGGGNLGVAIARAHKKGDDSYNARRRYVRYAKQNLRKAERETGATAARYRRVAEESYKRALQTYANPPKKFSKDITAIGNRVGYTYDRAVDVIELRRRDMKTLLSESEEFTKRGLSKLGKPGRKREAETVFNSPIGKRIIGGLEGVWRNTASYTVEIDGIEVTKIDKEKIFPALFDYFGVDNLADLLEKVESEIGEELYTSEGGEVENYDVVKLAIVKAYKSGAFVA